MTLKSMAQMNVMSSMGSYDAAHLRTTSSPTFVSVSSGASVMLVPSREENHHKYVKTITLNARIFHCKCSPHLKVIECLFTPEENSHTAAILLFTAITRRYSLQSEKIRV